MQIRRFLWIIVGVLVAGVPAMAQGNLSAALRGAARPGVQLGGEAARITQQGVSSLSLQVGSRVTRQQMRNIVRQGKIPGPFINSTFVARTLPDMDKFSFSGTVIEVQNPSGKKEIFGVVPAHAISEGGEDLSLKRFFTAGVYKNGKLTSIPAEVVQVSAPSMLDLALVKFHPEDEALFTPLKISRQKPVLQETLQSQGYVEGKPVYLAQRTLLDKTQFSLRTSMLWPRVQRAGLCGSPVVNNTYELVGIHTGSSNGATPEEDIAYATPAPFLNVLVAAYYNEGKSRFPFYLKDRPIFDLDVDEFISQVRVENELGENLWKKTVHYKFPHSKFLNALSGARYVEFSINRVQWQRGILIESHVNSRVIRYDLQAGEIVDPVLPAE